MEVEPTLVHTHGEAALGSQKRQSPPVPSCCWEDVGSSPRLLVSFSRIGASSSKKYTLVSYYHYKLFSKHSLAVHYYISENPISAELHVKCKHKNVKKNHL